MRQQVKKIIALLLLFLFMEKAGLRLFIHARYHEYAAIVTERNEKESPKKVSVAQVTCDCLDDFFIPIHSADEITMPLPATIACARYKTNYTSQLSSSTQYLFYLRGPPITKA